MLKRVQVRIVNRTRNERGITTKRNVRGSINAMQQ